jgi:multidrug efflux pump subunit AcrB
MKALPNAQQNRQPFVREIVAAMVLALPSVSSASSASAESAIVITVAWGRTQPETVEREITYPVEKLLKDIPRLVQLRSTSYQGGVTITVVLPDLLCTDIDAVSARLRQAQSSWPRDASAPVISTEGAPCK